MGRHRISHRCRYWTQPYPGSGSNEGFTVQLSVAQDVPIPEDLVQNATTAASSLTFGVPGALQGEAMHDSWYICRHIFISTSDTARDYTKNRQGSCGFLSDECVADLRSSLTAGWGEESDEAMCSALTFDAIPETCVDSFGPARQDVIGKNCHVDESLPIIRNVCQLMGLPAFDAMTLQDSAEAALHTKTEQSLQSWRIGTG